MFFKNDAILKNHGSFFQGKDSLQLDRLHFLKINSLVAEMILMINFQKLETV